MCVLVLTNNTHKFICIFTSTVRRTFDKIAAIFFYNYIKIKNLIYALNINSKYKPFCQHYTL